VRMMLELLEAEATANRHHLATVGGWWPAGGSGRDGAKRPLPSSRTVRGGVSGGPLPQEPSGGLRP
jgi:hypothetical protein